MAILHAELLWRLLLWRIQAAYNSITRLTPIEVAAVSALMPFNFAVLLSLRNSRNKGHANVKGFTVNENELIDV